MVANDLLSKIDFVRSCLVVVVPLCLIPLHHDLRCGLFVEMVLLSFVPLLDVATDFLPNFTVLMFVSALSAFSFQQQQTLFSKWTISYSMFCWRKAHYSTSKSDVIGGRWRSPSCAYHFVSLVLPLRAISMELLRIFNFSILNIINNQQAIVNHNTIAFNWRMQCSDDTPRISNLPEIKSIHWNSYETSHTTMHKTYREPAAAAVVVSLSWLP